MNTWLLVTCGLPFSGKSTLARSVADLLDFELVAVDEHHEALGVEISSGILEARDWLRAYRSAYAQVDSKLASGRSVVFDSVGFRRRDRDRASRIARNRGADTVVVWLDIEASIARQRLERNKSEPRRPQVPSASFDLIATHFETPDPDETYVVYRSDVDSDIWVKDVLSNKIKLEGN